MYLAITSKDLFTLRQCFPRDSTTLEKLTGQSKEIKQNLRGPKNFDIKFAHIDCYSQNFISET